MSNKSILSDCLGPAGVSCGVAERLEATITPREVGASSPFLSETETASLRTEFEAPDAVRFRLHPETWQPTAEGVPGAPTTAHVFHSQRRRKVPGSPLSSVEYDASFVTEGNYVTGWHIEDLGMPGHAMLKCEPGDGPLPIKVWFLLEMGSRSTNRLNAILRCAVTDQRRQRCLSGLLQSFMDVISLYRGRIFVQCCGEVVETPAYCPHAVVTLVPISRLCAIRGTTFFEPSFDGIRTAVKWANQGVLILQGRRGGGEAWTILADALGAPLLDVGGSRDDLHSKFRVWDFIRIPRLFKDTADYTSPFHKYWVWSGCAFHGVIKSLQDSYSSVHYDGGVGIDLSHAINFLLRFAESRSEFDDGYAFVQKKLIQLEDAKKITQDQARALRTWLDKCSKHFPALAHFLRPRLQHEGLSTSNRSESEHAGTKSSGHIKDSAPVYSVAEVEKDRAERRDIDRKKLISRFVTTTPIQKPLPSEDQQNQVVGPSSQALDSRCSTARIMGHALASSQATLDTCCMLACRWHCNSALLLVSC